MGINWGGLGDAFAGLGGIAQQFGAPERELEALKNKAFGLAQIIEPNLLAMSPEAQNNIMKPLVLALSGTAPKSNFGQDIGSGIMQAFGLGGQQQPGNPIDPIKPGPALAVNPAGVVAPPKFKIGDRVRLKDGQIFDITDDADIQAAIESGAVIYK